jgi:hypothetical protein
MAQTRRRRQTKHRGNAAGMVESRGRTGRKPTSEEKRGPTSGKDAAGGRPNRLDRPPTWRGAFVRAMAAAVVMLLISILILKKPNQAVALFPAVLVIYVPISYYTDLWLYRRRQAAKLGQAGARGRRTGEADGRRAKEGKAR